MLTYVDGNRHSVLRTVISRLLTSAFHDATGICQETGNSSTNVPIDGENALVGAGFVELRGDNLLDSKDNTILAL